MNGQTANDLARATARSIVARQQLANTLVDLQARLAPNRLLRDGLDELRETAGEIASDALDQVRARPGQVAGVVAAIVMYLARDQIADLISAAGKTVVKPLRRRRVTSKSKALPRKDKS